MGPSFVPPIQIITNMTGQPSLTVPVGFVERPTRAEITAIGATPRREAAAGETLHRVPHGITLWGRLYDEGAMLRLGLELERAAGVWQERPALG
jgi:Asp-tRNA(Asn)/Glu-tRNA(Gln) amidotransferase A subunit family amidase